MSTRNLRAEMPVVTEFIDELRKAFGADNVNLVIRQGLNGKPVFFARENGHTIGTPMPTGIRVGKDERGNSVLLDADTSPPDISIPSHRERHYQEAYARSRALTTAKPVQTSAHAPQWRGIKR